MLFVVRCELFLRFAMNNTQQTTNNTPQSKRNIIFLKLLFFTKRLLGRGLLLGSGASGRGSRLRGARWRRSRRACLSVITTGSGIVSTAAASTTAVLTTNELEGINDYRQLTALSATLLVFPLVEFETTLNEDGFPFGEILIDQLCSFGECRAIHEGSFFAIFTIDALKSAIRGNSKIDHRCVG
jgi:hypothetical protein